MTPLALALVFVIIASPGTEQTAAHTPTSIAWTAYRAAESGDRSQVAALEALVPALLEQDDREGRYALGSVLDALWRLGGRPGLDLIPRISQTHPVEAVMFLTRFGAERDAVALPLLQQARGYEWLALANLMLDTKPSGYGAIIAKDLRVLILVTVSEDGRAISGRGIGPATGCGIFGSAAGFPPLAAYRLQPDRKAHAPLLVSGPRAIYYERLPGVAGVPPSASVYDEEVRADERLAYLGALLGTSAVGLAGMEHHGIAWAGAAELIADTAALKRAAENRYNGLLDALASAGVLDSREREGLSPKVNIDLVDMRRDTSEPLPTMR